MGILQVELAAEIYDSLVAYNTSTAYDGKTKVFDLLQEYGGVRFKRLRSKTTSCGAKNMNERTVSTNYVQLREGVWAHIADSLVADFETDANAQRIIPVLYPMAFLDTSAFSLITDVSDDAKGGIDYGISFVPNFTGAFYQLGTTGLKDGLWGKSAGGDGTGSVALTRESSNSLIGSVASNYNTKNIKFRLFDSAFGEQQASQTAAVSSGGFTYTATPAAGAYVAGFVFIDSIIYSLASDAAAFRTSVDLAKMPGFVNIITTGYAT